MLVTGREGFVVAVRRNGSALPAGVGFVVAKRHVVTCAHVVNVALGRAPRDQDMPGPDTRIEIVFPMLGDAEGAPVRACRLERWLPPPRSGPYGGDIACLVLVGEDIPAEAGSARLVDPVTMRDVSVDLFGFPGDPSRTLNGAWAEHRLRGAVGGGVIQLDADSQSALQVQPGYSGSPAIISDGYGDAVIGMLAVASDDRMVRDAYAIPVERLVDIWPEVLADRTLPACPYRGLQVFSRNDAEDGLFVGREVEVEQLRKMVDLHSLTVVVGPSGVGKSSLVTAGLIPMMEREGWNTTLFRPGQHPFDALAKALLVVERPGVMLTRNDLNDLANQLRSDGLARYAAQLRLLTSKPTLLYVDQFEETLTGGSPDERRAFLDLVLTELTSNETGLHIVCTLRADFLVQILEYPDCGPRLQDRLLTLSPMRVKGLERVIKEPALVRGVEYEEGLAMHIADDAIAGGGLPLLEFALTELWSCQQRKQIRYSDYFSIGGVSGRLSGYAEQVFAELVQRYPEGRIQKVMLKLVRSRGGAAEATRRIVQKIILEDEWPLIEELARRRLIVISSDITGYIVTVELSHEALIQAWARFKIWVDDDSEFQRWLVFAEERALEGDTLYGVRLEEAQKWLAGRSADISPEIVQLIDRSEAERERLAKERERFARELAEALRQTERYRSLVQVGAVFILVANPDGDMIEDCPEWRWVTGQTEEEYLGSGWLDTIHPEDRDRAARDWQACVKSGKIFDDRYRVRTRAGSYRHYDVRAVPVERDGRIVEWVGSSTDVTGQREAEELRGTLTEQLSAAALRSARLQQATSMLAEALTVEQVVEVITEVGRTAIAAQRSAVALLDGGRLKVINPAGMPPGQSAATRDILLDSPGVMTRAIATLRPVLAEDPRRAARAAGGRPDRDCRRGGRAVLGGAAAAGGRGPAGRAAVLLRPPAEDHRGGARLPRSAGRAVRPGRGARRHIRAGAHHGGDAATQLAPGSAAAGARPGHGGAVPAGRPEHGDRRGLVRRVPAAGRAAGHRGRRRHGQGADRRRGHGPGPQRAARARAVRPAARGRAERLGSPVQRHGAGGANYHRRVPGHRPADRRRADSERWAPSSVAVRCGHRAVPR